MTTGTIIRIRQQTTTITYEKSQTTSAHIDLTNTQKVRQIHQHKIFNINLPVKLFPKEALQETKDSHKSLDDCKSNGTQTRRHILDCVLERGLILKIKRFTDSSFLPTGIQRVKM
jgi:hypothetical protein